jgi:hypothetical protein
LISRDAAIWSRRSTMAIALVVVAAAWTGCGPDSDDDESATDATDEFHWQVVSACTEACLIEEMCSSPLEIFCMSTCIEAIDTSMGDACGEARLALEECKATLATCDEYQQLDMGAENPCSPEQAEVEQSCD